MKNHLKALLEYEVDNHSLDLLCEFISSGKTDLIDAYCGGKINLLSFILIKKLKDKYVDLIQFDPKLNALFENAIKCSKIFYNRTLKILVIKDVKFENIFMQQIQPIGQQLVNLLINIKFRIQLVKLQQAAIPKTGVGHFLEKISAFTKPFRKVLAGVLYKLSLFGATNYKYVPFIYTSALLLLLPLMLLAEHYFINDINIETSYINIIFCISVLIASILAYPIKRFGKIDIYGHDVVAYKYRVFFNNILNKKMYEVFALEHSNIARHETDQGID